MKWLVSVHAIVQADMHLCLENMSKGSFSIVADTILAPRRSPHKVPESSQVHCRQELCPDK